MPQLILFTVSFQCITPIFGSSNKVMATIVLVEVSILCTIFSVVQKNSRHSEITSSFFSSVLILPISFSSLLTVACPPAISSISGGIICIISLYNATDINNANGAAAINQSSQEISTPKIWLIKFTATMFCAAAVLMPTFHTLSTCATVIISIPAKRLLRGSPKALIMPITIGTRQATRAVVLGTKKLKIKPHKITPIKTRFDFAPTLERITSAIRLSSPVLVIAAAKNIAAATRQNDVEEKPFSAMPSPALVPYSLPVSGLGAKPTKSAIKTIITPALTG